jgi:hypothetical protein
MGKFMAIYNFRRAMFSTWGESDGPEHRPDQGPGHVRGGGIMMLRRGNMCNSSMIPLKAEAEI